MVTLVMYNCGGCGGVKIPLTSMYIIKDDCVHIFQS